MSAPAEDLFPSRLARRRPASSSRLTDRRRGGWHHASPAPPSPLGGHPAYSPKSRFTISISSRIVGIMTASFRSWLRLQNTPRDCQNTILIRALSRLRQHRLGRPL